MSYTIIYKRQFIKAGDRYAILELTGDNNVYTGKRRARDWYLYIPSTILMTKGQLIGTFDTMAKNNPSGQFFKYQNKWVDGPGLSRYVRNGIRTAMTIEEICRLNHISYIRFRYGARNQEKTDAKVSNTSEFEALSLAISKWFADNPKTYISLEIYGLPENLVSSNRAESNNVPVVVTYGKSQYVTEVSGDSVRTSGSFRDAMIFENAEAAREKIQPFFFQNRSVRIVPAKGIEEKKKYAWFIKHDGVFVKRKTSRHIFFTENIQYAKGFKSQEDAQRYIDTFVNRLKNVSVYEPFYYELRGEEK